jgi:hypothetical protein
MKTGRRRCSQPDLLSEQTGSARRITQVVARRMNWLVGVTLCWYTTASRRAAGVSIYPSLVPAELDTHSWLLHIPGLWSLMDRPDLTALGRARFLVQYRTDDELFSRAGMEDAHDHLLSLHAGSSRYRGSFKPGGHAFDAAMQDEAWAFLTEAM